MMQRTMIGSLWVVLGWSLAATAQSPALSGVWPQFRGPNRDGVSPETGLLTQWPENGPPLVWETKGAGRGYSSLAIVGDSLFTMGDGPSTADDKDEYVLCFHRADGKPKWKAKAGPAWNSGTPDWQSSRSTPTVDGALLYALTPHGELLCLETVTGKEVWRKHLMNDFGGKKGDGWGYSESVLIDGDKLVCTPGGAKTTMLALNKKTADVIWKATAADDRGAGHASIVVSEVGGVRVYVNTTASGVLGVRADDGKVLWTYGIDKTTAVIPNPIIRGDFVFFSAGYNRGGALLKQVPDGDRGVKVEEVYPLNKELNNKHGGIVLVGDHLYGDTNDGGAPFCAEFKTGKNVWKERGGRGSAAVLAADGHLYIRWAEGKLALVKATPEKYEAVGSFKIPGSGDRPSWSHPVIADGKLYVREGDAILCYDVKAKK